MNRLLLFLGLLCCLMGCAHAPAQLAPPQIVPPKTHFTVMRDYNTTWNALLRAVAGMKGQHIKSSSQKTGTLVLKPVTVRVQPYCDCGKLGENPLSGEASRRCVVRIEARAPQETIIEILCEYATTHNWKNMHGEVVRKETIPCISNGQFEWALYQHLIRYLSP